MIFNNLEDMFYKFLKKEGQFNNPGWPFLIMVRDVDVEKTLIDATFKHRKAAGEPETSSTWSSRPRRRVIKFDTDEGRGPRLPRRRRDQQRPQERRTSSLINDTILEMPTPTTPGYMLKEKKLQERTNGDMVAEQVEVPQADRRERKRQAIDAALCIGSGRMQWVRWPDVQTSFVDYGYWTRRVNEYETEKQLRSAQAFGSLFFVLLGAPVGIIFAKRDFLSAFISCFLPIITLYYPLMLLGINLGKEDVVNPVLALWCGNVLLGVLAGFTLPKVIRH